jgi:ribosomal protein L7/L12
MKWLITLIALVLLNSLMGRKQCEAKARFDSKSGIGVSDTVRQLTESGKKIAAIKQLRAETGLGLKDAKEVVDSL